MSSGALKPVPYQPIWPSGRTSNAQGEVTPAAADVLLPRVYDDVSPRLHPLALRSLKAHLLKLRDDARAVEREERWSLLA